MEKERLDIALVKRGLIESRTRAQQLIKAGKVIIDGKIITKPSFKIDKRMSLILVDRLRYVGRGGIKLEEALKKFKVDVNGFMVLDVGASTGGFTDCLLQHGASGVYAVDVGQAQISPKLRKNPKVKVLEDTDIRTLKNLPELMDLIVIDVSLISLRLILPDIGRFLKPEGRIIALIKPQFEVGLGKVDKRGVIKDQSIRQKVVTALLDWIQEEGWRILGLIPSPIAGKGGNIEYFVYLSKTTVPEPKFNLKETINELFQTSRNSFTSDKME